VWYSIESLFWLQTWIRITWACLEERKARTKKEEGGGEEEGRGEKTKLNWWKEKNIDLRIKKIRNKIASKKTKS
jgi:hypothetical protein